MGTKKASFRIIFKPEPEGGYTVIVPSLPGCITYGSDMKEAREMAKDAIKAYLESMKKHGEAFSDDSDTVEGMLTLQTPYRLPLRRAQTRAAHGTQPR